MDALPVKEAMTFGVIFLKHLGDYRFQLIKVFWELPSQVLFEMQPDPLNRVCLGRMGRLKHQDDVGENL